MNSYRLLLSVVILTVIASVSVVFSEADGQDVDYVVPPEADNIIMFSVSDLKSDDPVRVVSYGVGSAAGYLPVVLYNVIHDSHSDYEYSESHCLPSWVSWDVTGGNSEAAVLNIRISPALQHVSEDTHGDYWIHFVTREPSMSSTIEDSYLIKFHLDIQWNGSVIVKDTVYHTYVLCFDSFGGSVSQTYYKQVVESADTGICYFDTTSSIPTKSGYKFLGWSTVSGDTAPLDVADEFPFVRSSADSVNSSDPLNIVYTKTLYAVWEPNGFLNSWDQLLSLMLNPVFLIVFTLIVIVLALFIRHRRIGGYY